ncbi:hypothetical protein ACU686_04035 [Yinghuangia aomiensis]
MLSLSRPGFLASAAACNWARCWSLNTETVVSAQVRASVSASVLVASFAVIVSVPTSPLTPVVIRPASTAGSWCSLAPTCLATSPASDTHLTVVRLKSLLSALSGASTMSIELVHWLPTVFGFDGVSMKPATNPTAKHATTSFQRRCRTEK